MRCDATGGGSVCTALSSEAPSSDVVRTGGLFWFILRDCLDCVAVGSRQRWDGEVTASERGRGSPFGWEARANTLCGGGV